MRFRIIPLIFLLIFGICEAKPPALTPKDTRVKIEEILKAHVSHQSLTTDLIQRTLSNYIDELDPSKTYFIESELEAWLKPSDQLLQETLQGFKKEDFTVYEKIHAVLDRAILRRSELEKNIDLENLPKNPQPFDVEDLKWTATQEELQERLTQIKALQLEAAAKIKEENREQFLQKLNKRRLSREADLTSSAPDIKKQIILSFVLKATSSALDSQTHYFTPSEANQFMMQVQQRLFGIGAQLRDDLNGFSIVRLLDGGPAISGNKIRVGDRIIGVDHQPVVGMDITEAVELIRGPQGTPVHLTLVRENTTDNGKQEEILEIDIIRGEVILTESRFDSSYQPFGDGIIAHLTLYSFYQDAQNSSASDLRKAIERLQAEHKIKGVILDLRNNAGGLLTQGVAVTGLFIKKGIVVSIKDNSGQIQHLRNIDEKPIWDGPLVVLTNIGSASASEIVAQTLKDYGRAILVGDQKTFGKGSFQTFTLDTASNGKVNPKGEYKVTRGRYYTVSGKSPQLTGVSTDIVVPGLFSEIEYGEQFTKFPLANDSIPPNFEDNLADIPQGHRDQVMKIYKNNLQPILHTYDSYFENLRINSEQRILLNQNYQNFLKEIKKKDANSEVVDFFGQSDLQLMETFNVMKDLLFLMQTKESQQVDPNRKSASEAPLR
ncbi:MAG: PDZ domain-containing protein [Chlamydiae bacterium]|nr:PDZ domain-containing protein [Chlamydiota bacterium]